MDLTKKHESLSFQFLKIFSLVNFLKEKKYNVSIKVLIYSCTSSEMMKLTHLNLNWKTLILLAWQESELIANLLLI